MFNSKNNVLLEGILAELKMINVVVTKLIAHEMLGKTQLLTKEQLQQQIKKPDIIITTPQERREKKLKYMRDYYKRTHPGSISRIDDIQPKKVMGKHIPKQELKTITLNGKKYTYSEFAKKLGVNYDFVYNCVYHGKSVSDIIALSFIKKLGKKK